MENSKTKPKFQSTEDYLEDYEAYKKGYKYKVLYADGNCVIKIVYLRSTYLWERLNPVGVVDLVLKFRNIL